MSNQATIIRTETKDNTTILLSPYEGVDQRRWPEVTKQLLDEHPLERAEVVNAVLNSWRAIFESKIGEGYIGTNIFPQPQNMGFLLHELIPLELAKHYPSIWRRELTSDEKDIVCIPNDAYSIEVKTSSNPTKIFGNRSYAQKTTRGKKAKNGYYIAVNFQKFSDVKKPEILRIRFGWLDSADWRGQKAATGQQSNLPPEVYAGKFELLYEK